jgi:hypothetical protein
MKTNDARIEVTKNGDIQVTVTIPDHVVKKADEWAARLPASREEVLLHHAVDVIEAWPDLLDEFCRYAWEFPTREAAAGFCQREKLYAEAVQVSEVEPGVFKHNALEVEHAMLSERAEILLKA